MLEIEYYRNMGNIEGFQRLKAIVINPDAMPSTITPIFHNSGLSPPVPPSHLLQNGSGKYLTPIGPVMPSTAYAQGRETTLLNGKSLAI